MALRQALQLVNLASMKRCMAAGLGLAIAVGHLSAAQGLPARAAGLWQSVTSVLGPDGQPLAGAQNVQTVTCVDPDTDEKLLLSGQNACSQLSVTGSGADYHIDGTCKNQGTPLQIHETLDYADAKHVTLKAAFKSEQNQMSLTSDLQWQGPCLPGMQPGDEGSLVNGAFSKADNINDPGAG